MTDRQFVRNPEDAIREARDRRTQSDAARTYATTSSTTVVPRLKDAGDWWWLRPGVMVALAESGASSDEMAEIARIAAQDASAFVEPGDPVRAELVRGATEATRRLLVRSTSDDDISFGDAVRSPIRLAFSALESGWQEVQGAARGIADALHPDQVGRTVRSTSSGTRTKQPEVGFGEGFVGSQSSLGILIDRMRSGDLSLREVIAGSEDAQGSGFFPRGEVAREQAERARRSASIDGHALTPGRLGAYAVTEPGTLPYNIISGAIDAGLITVADPANVATAGIGRAVQARRVFQPHATGATGRLMERVGLLNSPRRTTLSESVAHWLDHSSQGQRFSRFVTETTNPVDIWLATSRKLPVADAVALADETDPVEVRRLLDRVLGIDLTSKPRGWVGGVRYTHAGLAVRRRAATTRLWAQMPASGLVDTTNPDEFAEQVNRLLVNANVDRATTLGLTERAMRASLQQSRYDVLTTAQDAVRASLQANGLSTGAARDVTKIWDSFERLRAYNIDALTGHERPLPDFVTVGGAAIPAPTPQILEQYLSRYVPFPDRQTLREIRSMTGLVGTVAGKAGVADEALKVNRYGHLAADSFLRLWKPLKILRPAYIGRVVGDEQARMASAGMASMFSHPLSYLSIAIADDGRIGKLLDNVPGVTTGRLGTDVFGDPFAEVVKGPLAGTRRKVAADQDSDFAETLYRSTTEMFGDGARRVQLPGHIAVRVGEPGYVDAWADQIKLLHDNPVAQQIAKGVPLPDIQEWFWNSSYRSAILGSPADELSPLATQVRTRAGADRWVSETMVQWVDDITQRDEFLVQAVAEGRLVGAHVHRDMKLTKEARAHLDNFVKHDVRPEFVIGSPALAAKSSFSNGYDEVINFLFDSIATRPSNWGSRGPTFRQNYWRRVRDLLGEASPEARDEILTTGATAAKLPKSATDRLRKVKVNPKGDLTIEDIDRLANKYAADETKALLYDLSNRGQFFDALRLIFPFGEAWKEVLTTWGHLLTENPGSLRTVQRVVEGARGAGFFYKDPSTGEEVFSYPGTPALTSGLLGLPGGTRGGFVGSTSGLSIAGSVIPGIGPAVQWSASLFLPDRPEFDRVRDVLFQYGGEDQGLLDTFLPSFVQKFQTWRSDPQSDRQLNGSVGEMMNVLAASGEYDLTNIEEWVRLEDDAADKGARVWFIRGMLQAFVPSAPQPRFEVKTGSGRWLAVASLIEDFRQKQAEDYDTAVARFIDEHGPDVLLFMVPRSKSEVDGLMSTDRFADFERSHRDLFRLYPQVAAMFAPTDGEHDQTVYDRQFRNRQRRTLSQRERLERGLSTVAAFAYRHYEAQVGPDPTDEQRAWLSQVRDELIAAFPGYNPDKVQLGSNAVAVRAIEQAANHESIRDTRLAGSIREYFTYRQQAIDATTVRGWQTAKSTAHLRTWLRQVGEEIVDENPGFARVWRELLSRELKDDDPAEMIEEQIAA